MNAYAALDVAHAAGVRVTVEGADLVLEAANEPPAAVLEQLSQHKAAIVRMLRPRSQSWWAEDWQALFDERAGIAEFDGGLPRAEAEAHALDICVAEWLTQHPVRSPPELCLGCGNGEHVRDPLVPYGIETNGYAWLHSGCWHSWWASRKVAAMTALAAMGIAGPPME